MGSSPRVRGTPLVADAVGGLHGIIPACAGNTSTASRPSRSTWDHPRVCGEHPLRPKAPTGSTGSSPRVRGTLLVLLVLPVHHGIIPACAGNTSCPPEPACRPRDHPRVCGEHFTLISMLLLSSGSSPRVRGTPSGFFKVRSDLGIIPACAGNTLKLPTRSTYGRDHPRVCGEHRFFLFAPTLTLGSSPRVRGTQD